MREGKWEKCVKQKHRITTDVALRDIVNKKFLRLVSDSCAKHIYRCGGSVGVAITVSIMRTNFPFKFNAEAIKYLARKVRGWFR